MLEINKRDWDWFIEIQQMFKEAQAALEEAQVTTIRAMDQGQKVFLNGLHAEVDNP